MNEALRFAAQVDALGIAAEAVHRSFSEEVIPVLSELASALEPSNIEPK
jgi:hypothetical protein